MPSISADRHQPTISVVVCTHNRSSLLAEALRSLQRLELNAAFDFEILVVDNASTDDTRQVVESLAGDTSTTTVRYTFEPTIGVAYARNRGVQEAAGEWIAFFDDDQAAEPNWLSELFGFAIAKNVLCAGGRVALRQLDGMHRNLGPLCRDLLSETVNQPVARRYDRRFKPGAGNLLIHRRVIAEVGGFHPFFNDRGEDTILFLKIYQAGYESWYTPSAVVHHVIPGERLTDAAFLDLARRVARRLPAFEKDYWQHLFPVAWAARIAQALFLFIPQSLLARFSGDRDRMLEARCQLLMARVRIRHGIKWLYTDNPLLLAEAL